MQQPRLSAGRPRHVTARRALVDGRCTTGVLVEIDPDGHPHVDWPGNPQGPLRARTVVDAPSGTVDGASVLLAFPDGDMTAPLVVGFLRDTFSRGTPRPSAVHVDTEQAVLATVAGLVLEAHREIVLRAGEASITIRADGTVILKGVKLLSRASETNRIKGAAVRIN